LEKQAKRLVKKYASLIKGTDVMGATMQRNPIQTTTIGKNCYKIRIAIASKGNGKSGGTRIITHFKVKGGAVYLLSIYDQYVKENITDK
jgi:hypothetical protein